MNLKRISDSKQQKKVKDSQGYPETLDELQDWGPSARDILEEFDQWADQDMKDDFMDSLSELFDGPESLDYNVCEYLDNTAPGEERAAVKELDNFLSVDKRLEFIEDFDRSYEFSQIG